jgi:hypothetical protein
MGRYGQDRQAVTRAAAVALSTFGVLVGLLMIAGAMVPNP